MTSAMMSTRVYLLTASLELGIDFVTSQNSFNSLNGTLLRNTKSTYELNMIYCPTQNAQAKIANGNKLLKEHVTAAVNMFEISWPVLCTAVHVK